jgi:lipopolysaccharide/colanic/teichoic acid biosynthesis glycosyltransferase
VVALPLLLVAIVIRIVDGSPVLYRQIRIGRNGKPFWFYKFRTMTACASGSLITKAGDARVTALGKVLRRWKLDELPQLWNVLRGDMTIIGARPEVERIVRRYTAAQRQILDFSPGIAGMSQLVYPHEAELLKECADPEEFYVTELMPKKIAVDLEYQRTRTFTKDLRLLAEIASFVVSGKSRHLDDRIGGYVPTSTRLL